MEPYSKGLELLIHIVQLYPDYHRFVCVAGTSTRAVASTANYRHFG